MTNTLETENCSILNKTDPKDSIDILKITEANQKQSSEYYVEHFKAFAVKTAQSTLEMCRIVAEAKNALTKDRFQSFCKQIGHENEDATIRKYITIGNKYEQFIKYAELLPNSWTSIYTITQLPSEVFNALVLNGDSMANMTGAQIKALMAPPTTSTTAASSNASAAKTDEAKSDTEAAQTQAQEATVNAEASDAKADADAAADAQQASSTTSESAETTSTSASADAAQDSAAQSSDMSFAQQATSKMLASASANKQLVDNSEDEDDEDDEFVPYSVTLFFNKQLSDEDTNALHEMCLKLQKKYGCEIQTNRKEELFV